MAVVVASVSVDRAEPDGERVDVVSTRVSSLIFAGWLPQDGLFCWSGSRV